MADFDWKKLVAGIAPALGTALGGPLVGAAVAELGGALLGNRDASESDVAAALAGGRLGPEQIVAIKQADNALAVRLRELDIDVMKINQAADAALIADTSDARHVFGANENVFVLGIFILLTFACLMTAVLVGCFYILNGGTPAIDPGLMTACGTLIGTVVGYVAANAQQVVSFFYGSSKGSKDSGQAIGQALNESIKQAGAKP